LTEGGEVDGARHCGTATEDQRGPVLLGQVPDLVEIDSARLLPNAVTDGVEPLPGLGDAPAMSQVPTAGQRHADYGVAGFAGGEVGGEVGWRYSVGLHIGVLGAEQRRGPLDG